jgi:hypothetical protein
LGPSSTEIQSNLNKEIIMGRNRSVKFTRKASLILSFAAGLVGMIGSLSAAQFTEVLARAIHLAHQQPTAP